MPPEPSRITRPQLQVYAALASDGRGWLTHADLEQRTEGLAPRTVRAATLTLVRAGVVEQAPVVWPTRYRLVANLPPGSPGRAHRDRLRQAAKVLGVDLPAGRHH
jgi:DNA-binding IclR family transcriptional regulator